MAWWKRRRIDGQAVLDSLNEELTSLLSAFDAVRSLEEHCRTHGTPLSEDVLFGHAKASLVRIQHRVLIAESKVDDFFRASREFRVNGDRLHDYDVILIGAACNAIKVACTLEKELRLAENPAEAFLALHFDAPGLAVSEDRRTCLADLNDTARCVRYAWHRREYDPQTKRYEYPTFLRQDITERVPPLITDGVAQFRKLYRI